MLVFTLDVRKRSFGDMAINDIATDSEVGSMIVEWM